MYIIEKMCCMTVGAINSRLGVYIILNISSGAGMTGGTGTGTIGCGIMGCFNSCPGTVQGCVAHGALGKLADNMGI